MKPIESQNRKGLWAAPTYGRAWRGAWRPMVIALLVCGMSLSLTLTTQAREALQINASSPVTQSAEKPDRTDLTHWANDYLETAKANDQFVGAALAIVGPDGPLLVRGYGHGDHKKQDPIHPDITYLPIGELGNIFVIEALLELQDQDRMSLRQPAQTFLSRISLPQAYRHLSTQDLFGNKTNLTPSVRGTQKDRSETEMNSLAVLREMIERSALEPRSTQRPSPLAQAIAGLVLEDVSGMRLEALLQSRLEDIHGVSPFLNSPSSQHPKYTVLGHTITKFGTVTPSPFYASTEGFVASNGIYLTASDIAAVLSHQLKTLSTASPDETLPLDLIVSSQASGGNHQTIKSLSTKVSSSSIEVSFYPEFEIAVFALVNSQAKFPDVEPGKGRTPILPPLSASDIIDDFSQTFLGSKVRQKQPSPRLEDGLYSRKREGLAGPDKILSLLAPKVRVRTNANNEVFINGDGPYRSLENSVDPERLINTQTGKTIRIETGSLSDPSRGRSLNFAGETFNRNTDQKSVSLLSAIFLLSVVLQFAIFASIKWPVTSKGQHIAKWVGIISVLTMTSALVFPIGLLISGHSPFIIDAFFTVSKLAFPIAALLALATLCTAIIAWRRDYWASDGFGFQRRLCFSAGALGLAGLAFVMVEMNLAFPLV